MFSELYGYCCSYHKFIINLTTLCIHLLVAAFVLYMCLKHCCSCYVLLPELKVCGISVITWEAFASCFLSSSFSTSCQFVSFSINLTISHVYNYIMHSNSYYSSYRFVKTLLQSLCVATFSFSNWMHTQAIVLKHVCTCPCNYVFNKSIEEQY